MGAFQYRAHSVVGAFSKGRIESRALISTGDLKNWAILASSQKHALISRDSAAKIFGQGSAVFNGLRRIYISIVFSSDQSLRRLMETGDRLVETRRLIVRED